MVIFALALALALTLTFALAFLASTEEIDNRVVLFTDFKFLAAVNNSFALLLLLCLSLRIIRD